MITREKLMDLRQKHYEAMAEALEPYCYLEDANRKIADKALRVAMEELNIEVEEPSDIPATMSNRELLEHAIKYKYPVYVENTYDILVGVVTLDDRAAGRFIINDKWYRFKNVRSVKRVAESTSPPKEPSVMPGISPGKWEYELEEIDRHLTCIWAHDINSDGEGSYYCIAGNIRNKANGKFLSGSKELAEAVIAWLDYESTIRPESPIADWHPNLCSMINALESMGCNVAKFRKGVRDVDT